MFRLRQEQVHMIGHEHVAEEMEGVPAAGLFDNLLECVAGVRGRKDVSVPVAADGDEVQVACSVATEETLRHTRQFRGGRFACANNPPFSMRLKRMGHPDVRQDRRGGQARMLGDA